MRQSYVPSIVVDLLQKGVLARTSTVQESINGDGRTVKYRYFTALLMLSSCSVCSILVVDILVLLLYYGIRGSSLHVVQSSCRPK